jgi:hypothetical protein
MSKKPSKPAPEKDATDATRSPALRPTEKQDPRVECGQPGGGSGRTDVTSVIRDKIRVDPDTTEGHPGYEETGPSEINSTHLP